MTNDQARDTYVQDMKALYADMLFVADSIGIDTTEVQLQLVETGPGVNVLNRPLNSGIREAQDLLDQQINRCIIIHTDGLNILDGVHYSPSGHIELGKRLANNDLARFQ
ncbi:MAG: hypothetical protein KI790_13000, partial [Cyclobacteriaceae bacterium]|nr:hypothetical protein [Cyclobacteriaceae bacterium HetDA_MAG_MS6]